MKLIDNIYGGRFKEGFYNMCKLNPDTRIDAFENDEISNIIGGRSGAKTCSCGVINKDLKLSDRVWTCKSCGATHDRDILAAVNIKSFALKNYLSVEHTSKNQDELPRLRGVLTPEAHLIAYGVGG